MGPAVWYGNGIHGITITMVIYHGKKYGIPPTLGTEPISGGTDFCTSSRARSGGQLNVPRDSMGYLDNMSHHKPTQYGTYKCRK